MPHPAPVSPPRAARRPGARRGSAWRSGSRRPGARWIALVAGLIGFLLALAVPFLPVQQTTSQLHWPQGPGLTQVTAPLTAYAPIDLEATVPCSAVADLVSSPPGSVSPGSAPLGSLSPDAGAAQRTVLSTAPAGTAGAVARALSVTVRAGPGGYVTVRSAGQRLARAPTADVVGGDCSEIRISSTAGETSAAFVGLDDPQAVGTADGDARPQIVGVFSDLTGRAPAGLSFRATVDTRYQASPTLAKWLAMGFALGLIAVSLAALARLDGASRRGGPQGSRAGAVPEAAENAARRARRRLTHAIGRRWRSVTRVDAVVVAVLVVWFVIGANTSDDGYELGMARAAEHAGYMPNYFRWFGAPEAPFGYPYYIFTALSHLSSASLLLRVPSLIAGLVCWFVLSREVLPRFGAAARRSRLALWTAGLVLLAFWLPYNNGLRPEPYIAAGILLTWVCTERAVARGRLLPLGLGLVIAGVTLTGGPTGTICFAPVVAAAPRLWRLIRRRAREWGGHGSHGRSFLRGVLGYGAALAPLFASVSAFAVVAFSRASIGPVLQATRMKEAVGPSEPWYDEYRRYAMLLSFSPDGSIARRFAVFAMLLGIVVCLVLLLRRGVAGRRWRVPGLAAGPARRAVVIAVLGLAFMTLNPTKWTHHFGVFAAVGAALAALAVAAVEATIARADAAGRVRGRQLFSGGVLIIAAGSLSSVNAWWYASNYGVPNGRWVTWVGWAVALALLVWGIVQLDRARRGRVPGEPRAGATSQPDVSAAALPSGGKLRRARSAGRARLARLDAAAPLPIAAGVLVALEVVSLAIAIGVQYPGYSVGLANVRDIAGDPCNMGDDILVEQDPNAAMLTPVAGSGPAGEALGAVEDTGFSPNGIPIDVSDPSTSDAGLVGDDPVRPDINPPGTGGGVRAWRGVNGSYAQLPYGLDPATTPVLGSYRVGDPYADAKAVSAWYALPDGARDGSHGDLVLAIAAAGELKRENFLVEFGRRGGGDVEVLGTHDLDDPGPSPSWRNLRMDLSDAPDGADVVRITAHLDRSDERGKAADRARDGDPGSGDDGGSGDADDDEPDDSEWIAFTPPRVPELTPMSRVVHRGSPVLMDWPVPLLMTCQRLPDYIDGVAELPGYLIQAERGLALVATNWSSAQGGGPLGWTELLFRAETLPTYLDGDVGRQWGELVRLVPRVPDAVPARLDVGTHRRTGWWTPGPIKSEW